MTSWPIRPLGSLAAPLPGAITDGPFGSNLTSAHYTDDGPLVVRLQNIGDGTYKHAGAHISQQHFESLRKHEVVAGDLLVASLGEALPRACLAPEDLGPAIVKADCIRVRLADDVEPRWVMYALQRPEVRRWAESHLHGVGRQRLGLKLIREIPVPVPPLEEQRRVVGILEDHLSRLDAADAYLEAAARRAERLAAAQVWQLTHSFPDAPSSRLDEVAEVRLGRQRSPANHRGERMRPYLRAANVDWNNLRLEDVKQMQFSEGEENTFRVLPNDILVVEASGSPREAGKSALYTGTPRDVCFQNTLLRVRCGPNADPRFLQKFLLAEAMAGRFVEGARGVGINHIGRAKLAGLPVTLPPLAAQEAAADRCDRALEVAGVLLASVREARERGDSLRRSLLTAAFSGRLTSFSSLLELAEGNALA